MNKIDELEKVLISEIDRSSLDYCVDAVLEKAKTLKTDPADSESILDLSLDYYAKDKFKQAYVFSMVVVGLQKLEGNKRTLAYCNAGRSAFRAGTVGIDLFPKDALVIFYFSECVFYAEKTGEYVKKYKKIYESHELIGESSEKTAITYYVYAKLLQKSEKSKESENLHRDAIDLDPKCAEAHYGYANLLFIRSSMNMAEKHYINAIKLKPYELVFHNNYANLLMRNLRNSESEKEIGLALEKDPKNFYANTTYGYLLLQEGFFEEAIEKYKIALENKDLMEKSGISKTYNNLGLCYWRKGKKREAENNIEKAMEIDPSNIAAIRNFRTIKKLKQDLNEHFTIKDILAELVLISFLSFLIKIFYIDRIDGLQWNVFAAQSTIIIALIVFILIRHDLKSFSVGTGGVQLMMNDQNGIGTPSTLPLEEDY